MDHAKKNIARFVILFSYILLDNIRQRHGTGLVTLHNFPAILVYNDDMVVFV